MMKLAPQENYTSYKIVIIPTHTRMLTDNSVLILSMSLYNIAYLHLSHIEIMILMTKLAPQKSHIVCLHKYILWVSVHMCCV